MPDWSPAIYSIVSGDEKGTPADLGRHGGNLLASGFNEVSQVKYPSIHPVGQGTVKVVIINYDHEFLL